MDEIIRKNMIRNKAQSKIIQFTPLQKNLWVVRQKMLDNM